MLHSMINNPRPTRAEVSDIANAVTQHTDALMLSGETAYGNYPVEAIATMSRVAMEMERSLGSHRPTPKVEADQTSFLARQAVVSTNLLGTRAILTDSYTGRTARYISSYRASYPTLAICYYPYVVRLLALSYGVSALYQPRMETTRVYLQNALTHSYRRWPSYIGRPNRISWRFVRRGPWYLVPGNQQRRGHHGKFSVVYPSQS